MTDQQIEHDLFSSRTLIDAPESVIQRALNLWTPRTRVAESAPTGLLQRVLATLSFDSRASPPLAKGLRSGASHTQQLLYSAEGHDVDLRITELPPSGGPAKWRISGQVFGPEAEGTIELTGPREPLLAAWDDMGHFAFEDVAGGQWVLRLRTATLEIEIPAIALPSP